MSIVIEHVSDYVDNKKKKNEFREHLKIEPINYT